MLKIATTDRTTVTARIAVRDASGEADIVEIKLTGLLRSQPDWDALFQRHAEAEGEKVVADVTCIYRANAKLYAEVFDGWQGVADEKGQPLAYSADALEVLLLSAHGPAANRALMQAMHDLRYGALEKN
jgi:hypothetical protein